VRANIRAGSQVNDSLEGILSELLRLFAVAGHGYVAGE